MAINDCAVVKKPPANAGDTGLISVSGRSTGEGNGYMDRGAWRATVCGITKSRTRLSDWHANTLLWKEGRMNLEGKQCLASSCSRERGWWRQPHGEVDGWGGIRSLQQQGWRAAVRRGQGRQSQRRDLRLNCVGGCVAPRGGRATVCSTQRAEGDARLSRTAGLGNATLLGSSPLT